MQFISICRLKEEEKKEEEEEEEGGGDDFEVDESSIFLDGADWTVYLSLRSYISLVGQLGYLEIDEHRRS